MEKIKNELVGFWHLYNHVQIEGLEKNVDTFAEVDCLSKGTKCRCILDYEDEPEISFSVDSSVHKIRRKHTSGENEEQWGMNNKSNK